MIKINNIELRNFLLAIPFMFSVNLTFGQKANDWHNRTDSVSCKMNFELNGIYSVELLPNPYYFLDEVFCSQTENELRAILVEITFFNERFYVSDIKFLDDFNKLEKFHINSIIRSIQVRLERKPNDSSYYSHNYPYGMVFKYVIGDCNLR
ncbi:MAG: hypothetical protein JXR03_21605 [Cyclobacteriaceae bacterium]